MPLPPNNTPWPPRQLNAITPVMQQWSAWYDGTPEALQAAYGRTPGTVGNPNDARVQFARDQRYGGFRGVLQRFWWGRPVNNQGGLVRDMLHVPIGADIAQASADLLFADPPKISSDNTKANDRLGELVNDGLLTQLSESAELAAALGGVYLRVTWDQNIRPDGPFLTALDADLAWPEFQWGCLQAVTFWQIIDQDGSTIWRHLERHELDSQGNGVIRHALYQGGVDNLGRSVPLNDKPATALYVDALNADGVISTGSPGLAVTYIPNQRPQRRWRLDPVGRSLGRSDYDGVEGLMDALDETYSSWMRDIRLGKARLVVARSAIEGLGPGKGATFDAEQEIYTALNVLSKADAAALPVEKIQFDIRYEQHQATAQQFVDDILRTAGYSTQTFGEGDTGNIRTATEVEQRERRSLMTRDRKLRHWRIGVPDILEKLLAVDKMLFKGKADVVRPDIEFPNGVQETQLNLAQTALAMRQAEAASDRVLVGMLHPDWDDTAIDDEVTLIQGERNSQMQVPNPDAGSFTGMSASESATAAAENDPTGSQPY